MLLISYKIKIKRHFRIRSASIF